MTDLWPQLTAGRINLAEEPDFDLGGMHVKPSQRAVEFDGRKQELQPRVMQVLVALHHASPNVVSRDKLIELCWEGRAVGDDAVNRCILALRHLAQEVSPPSFQIETVPRIGHRLVDRGSPLHGGDMPIEPVASRRNWRIVIVAAVALLMGISALFLWQRLSSPAEPASIAVLPFRNLSGGDNYFAEGVGEEVLNQLAREPAFRVAGRASSAQFTGESDPREVGRKLKVDYVLEGSVRSDRGRVRVNASLLQARDGVRLWSESFDRSLQDIFEIQTAIGQAVATELKRRLVRSSSDRRIVKGEAYALYLNARGLMRSLNPQSGSEAVILLQRATQIDPNFASAWSSLAQALLLEGRTKGPDGMIAVAPKAQQAAQRALRLDPRLAEAHAVMGQLLGTDTPQAIPHLRRAAELDPGGAESQISGGIAQEVSGEYAAAVSSHRHAIELDPLSPLPVRSLVGVLATMGDRAAAETAARRGFADDVSQQEFALSRIAWYNGDYSEAVRLWSKLSVDTTNRWSRPSRISLADARYLLGLSAERPETPILPTFGSARFGPISRILMSAPRPEEWRERNRSFAASLVYYDENIVAAKLMLNAGRVQELVATYDSPFGLLAINSGEPIGPCQLDEVPIVALALRRVGRVEEADTLLGKADALIRTVYARGPVPNWFEDDAGGVWAAQGKVQSAIAALSRAQGRGWMHTGRTDLPDMASEPAFRSLSSHPEFQALLARQRAHIARERAEAERVLGRPT